MVQRLRTQLENPSYYIIELDNTIRLSLIPIGVIKKTLSDPITAGNEFYYTSTQASALLLEKKSVLAALRSNLSASKNFLQKNSEKLNELKHDSNYKEWADLIMANLHQIKPNTEQITVSNFYNQDLPIDIKLKKTLSPQKNAELYYRKSKNQQMEMDRLQHAIHAKDAAIQKLEKQIYETEQATDLKEVRRLNSEHAPAETNKKQATPLPYHEFLINGFKIWVGKNAQSNDILTLKFGYKEDLWLHAKDVAGSHVLIKHQAGKNFPKDVIERAAQLAAYNSKRKNETLCPVVVTSKKYVRKRKGDPAGTVVVEREDVIMVEPRLPDWHCVQKKFNEAKAYFRKSYNASKEKNDTRFQLDNIDYLAQIYIKKGEWDQALALLKKAESVILDGSSYNLETIKIYAQFSKAYRQKGDFQKTALYQEKYIALKDSIYSEELTTNLMKVEADYLERENKAKIAAQEQVLLLNREIIKQ